MSRLRSPLELHPGRRAARRILARAGLMVAGGPPRPSLRILTYHRVNDLHPGDRMTVRRAAFRAQMELLAASGRPVLPLADSIPMLSGAEASLPHGAVCVTFDDGYRDNLTCAAPELDRLGLPATVYIVTGRMGAPAAIDRYLGCCDDDRSLTWEEAGALERRGHALGGHGRNHLELARLDAPALRMEVLGCQEDLARHLGAPRSQFCYPRGSEDAQVRAALAEAGFSAAVTVYPGVNPPGTDPFLLRRTEVSGFDEIRDFHLKMDGAFDALHRLWQRLRPRGA